jgi:alanyl-tRNA synthetase
LASQAKTGSLEDHISLDVHSIDELKSKGFKPTDDHFKYNYTANADGDYSFEGCQGKVVALRRNKMFVDQVTTNVLD